MNIGSTKPRRGFTLIELLSVIAVIMILIAVAMPHYSYTFRMANETSAVESLRILIAAQETYRHGRTPPTYGSIGDLASTGILRDDLGGGFKSGYTFITVGNPDSSAFTIVAMPQTNAGIRWFFADQTGTIRYREGDMPDVGSPPLE